MTKLALKRLTSSDLTFFEWHFRNRNNSNQKSINMNADVFVNVLYPSLKRRTGELNNPIPVALTLFGPGIRQGYSLARKILKGLKGHNWRLNGEFVHNPDEDKNRFNILDAGDLALFVFKGDDYPEAIDILFLSNKEKNDRNIFKALTPMVAVTGKKTMSSLRPDQLSSALNGVKFSENHPIRLFLADPEFEEALEDASFGNNEATLKVQRRRGARQITVDDIAKARANAERIGQLGEELVYNYLAQLKQSGDILNFEWAAAANAASPFDFSISPLSGDLLKIDAKSTEGPFERPIHISAAEMTEAAESACPYSIYRLYEITEDTAKLKIAQDIRKVARQITGWVAKLPTGIKPDGFTLQHSSLEWEGELVITRPDDSFETE